MPISKLKRAVFMHTQKTAGSAIVNMVAPHYGTINTISHAEYLKYNKAEINSVDFISGHFGYDLAKQFFPGRYSFTFLRDPIERLISLYCFCKSRDPSEFEMYDVASKVSFDDFLQHALDPPKDREGMWRSLMWNHQAWQLCSGWIHAGLQEGNSKNSQPHVRSIFDYRESEMYELATMHLHEFDVIGFQENFSVDAARILSNLGLPRPTMINRINQTANRVDVGDLPESTLSLLKKLTAIDREVYDYAWRIFRNANRYKSALR